MKPIYKRLLLFVLLPLCIGCLLIVPVITSDNGYVAGFVLMPLLIIVSIASAALFIGGLVATGMKGGSGLWVVLSGILLLIGFLGSGILAKHFALGAYREEPMRPIVARVSNKVIFRKEATQDEVQKFWSEVLSDRVGGSGERTRPGIQGISSNPPENGYEVVTFSFFENATEAEIADVRARILAYPPVYKYLENADTSAPVSPESKPVNGNSDTPVKKGTSFKDEQ